MLATTHGAHFVWIYRLGHEQTVPAGLWLYRSITKALTMVYSDYTKIARFLDFTYYPSSQNRSFKEMVFFSSSFISLNFLYSFQCSPTKGVSSKGLITYVDMDFWQIQCQLIGLFIWFSLLYNGYRVFPGGKVRTRRAADHSLPSSAMIMEE
jgi:hypothetical protein